MSSVDYTDTLVREALDRLRDELPGELDALNAAYADEHELVHPAADAYDDGTGVAYTTPWLTVYISDDELSGEGGYLPLGQQQATALAPLVVVVKLEEPLPGPALHTKLKRYVAAVTRVLADPQAFATFAPSVRRIRRSWRLTPSEQQELSSSGWVEFTYELDVPL